MPSSVCEGFTGAQSVEDILRGDRQVVYGLLWHLWQHSNARESKNNQRIRQSKNVEESATSSEVRPTPVMLDVPAITLAEEADRLRRKFTDEESIKRFTNACQSSAGQREIAWEPHTSDEGDIFPIKTEDICREDSESEDPDTDEPEGDIIQTDDSRKKLVPASMHCDVDEASSTTEGASSPIVSLMPRCSVHSFVYAVDHPPLRAAALHTLKRQLSRQRQVSPVQVDQQQLAEAEKQAGAILQWLKGLNIRLDRPEAFQVSQDRVMHRLLYADKAVDREQDPSAALTEFQSGVLLCRIVEKVEYLRGISGVVVPKVDCATRASALHNIKKALALLQHKKVWNVVHVRLSCGRERLVDCVRSTDHAAPLAAPRQHDLQWRSSLHSLLVDGDPQGRPASLRCDGCAGSHTTVLCRHTATTTRRSPSHLLVLRKAGQPAVKPWSFSTTQPTPMSQAPLAADDCGDQAVNALLCPATGSIPLSAPAHHFSLVNRRHPDASRRNASLDHRQSGLWGLTVEGPEALRRGAHAHTTRPVHTRMRFRSLTALQPAPTTTQCARPTQH
jgi:hypothetical protein